MANLINTEYKGLTITIAVTGLPITITGEVLSPRNGENDNIVTLKVEGGKIVNFANELIAFFF